MALRTLSQADDTSSWPCLLLSVGTTGWTWPTDLIASAPLYFLPWNPIYPVMTGLVLGAIGTVLCRPALLRKTLVGGVLIFGLYAVFMLGLKWLASGSVPISEERLSARDL